MTDNIVTDETTLPQNFGPEPEQVSRFIEHWAASGGAERENFPSFAHNLCDLLAVSQNLDLLGKLFTEPDALMPGETTAEITRRAAEEFARLADDWDFKTFVRFTGGVTCEFLGV